MQEARFWPDNLRDMGQEGDDIVLYDPFDLVDPVGIPDRIATLFPDDLG